MIRFLIKGLIRDRQRSVLPVIVVALGVTLTVLMSCWVTGVMGDSIEFSAKFSTGHVRVMSQAYAEFSNQSPNDLGFLGTVELLEEMKQKYPEITWVERIKFGGLADVPDEKGETRAQGPVVGLGVDLFSPGSQEKERMNLVNSLKRGRFPEEAGEVLLSEEFSQKLKLNPGDDITLISSTMYGSMSIYNLKMSGTIAFCIKAMDRGSMIMDISDARMALDMFDASSEILGYLPGGFFNREEAMALAERFNREYSDPDDEFSPVMKTMRDDPSLAMMVDFADNMSSIITMVFIIIMSIVLWNAGLLGGLRRYGEVGLRLAIGEEKGHIYRSMIYESVAIGFVGSVIGTAFGLFFAYLLQTKGVNVGDMLSEATIMMPSVMRARISPESWYIGFIPGLFSTILGTMLAGIGIYKRQTASLFKELEN